MVAISGGGDASSERESGAKDASKPFSEANVAFYAERPSEVTTSIYQRRRHTSGSAAAGTATSSGRPMRVIFEHPNDHMPPRQMESLHALAQFAEAFSPREREANSLAMA